MTRVWLASLFVLLAGAAHAQTLGEVLRDPPLYSLGQGQSPPYTNGAPPKSTRDDTALWVFVAAASADWSVTAICFQLQCGPDTKGFTGIESPKKGASVGLLIDGGFIYVVREWVQPDHPKLAQGLFYGAAVLRAILVSHKVSDLRRNTARTAPPGT